MENTQETTVSTKKRNPALIIVVLAILLIGGAILFWYHKPSLKEQSSESVENMQPEVKVTGIEQMNSTASATEDLTVNVEAGSFYYKPNVITIKKGQKIKLLLHSVSMMHNFNIDELDVHSPLVKNGETSTIEFSAEKAGTFEYYCSVGQHRKLGQVGKITITE